MTQSPLLGLGYLSPYAHGAPRGVFKHPCLHDVLDNRQARGQRHAVRGLGRPDRRMVVSVSPRERRSPRRTTMWWR